MRAAAAALAAGVALLALLAPGAPLAARARGTGCPPEMVRTTASCIDRWEASLVDDASGQALSPFYPPHPESVRRIARVWERERWTMGDASARALALPEVSRWQRTHRYQPRAVSRHGVLPSGAVNRHQAEAACVRAGKRLCSAEEWVLACRGAADQPFPYGGSYQAGRCNVHRAVHPAAVLHGDASVGHLDPRLNLVFEAEGEPLLRVTGGTPTCASPWGDDAVQDMVGNLDEWIDEPAGTFVGGFYARPTRKGCAAAVESHAPAYADYSTGFRCCRDPDDAAGGRLAGVRLPAAPP